MVCRRWYLDINAKFSRLGLHEVNADVVAKARARDVVPTGFGTNDYERGGFSFGLVVDGMGDCLLGAWGEIGRAREEYGRGVAS